jgi:carbon storage regulator
MLVLSRKPSERIIIGQGADKIVVTLVSIDRNQCRIGIEAPREIPVVRSELCRRPGEERT